jgi:hypothetical protein
MGEKIVLIFIQIKNYPYRKNNKHKNIRRCIGKEGQIKIKEKVLRGFKSMSIIHYNVLVCTEYLNLFRGKLVNSIKNGEKDKF